MPLLKVSEQLLGFVQTAFEASEQATDLDGLLGLLCLLTATLTSLL